MKRKEEVSRIGRHPVHEVYVLRRIRALADKAIEARKDALLSNNSGAKIQLSEGALRLDLTLVTGPGAFDPALAKKMAKSAMPPRAYNENFVHYRISRRPGVEIPPSLLKEMEKYFVVETVEEITEEKMKSLFPAEDVKSSCYGGKSQYYRMTTPTKISDAELAQELKKRKVDVVSRMLLEGGK